MNKAITVLLFFFCSTGPFALGNEDYTYKHKLASEDLELGIKVTQQPAFPSDLKSRGYTNGQVNMLLQIDYDGELRDWLVTSASHRAFAVAIERVIEKWRFEPPKRLGKPASLIVPIQVNFKASLDFVSFDMTAGLDHLFAGRHRDAEAVVVIADVDTLDSYPEAVRVVAPKAPKSLMKQNKEAVGVFKFFIDTDGSVRLAHVDHVEGEVDIRLLEVAQDALEQWQFKPPTVKGKKVVVEVKQPFLFAQSD